MAATLDTVKQQLATSGARASVSRVDPALDMTNRGVLGQLSRVVRTVVQKRGLEIEIRELMQSIDAFESDPKSAPAALAEPLTATRAGAVAFATAGVFPSQMGSESAILGPGRVDQAHEPNEYIEAAAVEKMIEIVEGFIMEFCCHD